MQSKGTEELKKQLDEAKEELARKDKEITLLKEVTQSKGMEELKKQLDEAKEELARKDKELKLLKEIMQSKEGCMSEIIKLKAELADTVEIMKKKEAEMLKHLQNDEERLKQSKSELEKLQSIRKDVEELVKLKDEELARLRKLLSDHEIAN
ncbi:uncharacterized protein aq_1476-like [Leucoraja erinacea]|uniref:uncharacterized protein aq_1476-like n=1 Tax=Leucoraja erinaceus TaxID=7782 RepID=UPI0024576919|nr:uncharacterized protein aq_1476-like [Leucoraja erinacea]